jgi:hypothetical protein
MRNLKRAATLFSVLVVALTLFSAVATALRSVQIREGEGRAIRLTAREVKFTSPELFGNTRCDLTLEGTSRERIAKRVGAVAGTITRAPTANCRESVFGGGIEARVLVPITVAYNSILGTLPNITGVLLTGRGGFLLRIPNVGIECLYEGTIGILVSVTRGVTGAIRFLEEPIPKLIALEGGRCTATGNLEGSGTMTALTLSLV